MFTVRVKQKCNGKCAESDGDEEAEGVGGRFVDCGFESRDGGAKGSQIQNG